LTSPEIDSVAAFIAALPELRKNLKIEHTTWNLWFRGHSDAGWTLLPSLYRFPTGSDVDPTWERELQRDFKIRLSTESGFNPSNDMDWIFIAQHHGLPTRILDWTENPLVALFFAVENYGNGKDGKLFAIHPGLFNSVVPFKGDRISVPTTEEAKFKEYVVDLIEREPRDTGTQIRRKPAAKLPMAFRPNSPFKRSMSQSGVFIVYGQEQHPINSFNGREVEVEDEDDKRLDKFTIYEMNPPSERKFAIFHELYNLGVSHGTLFGDPDSIAKSIKFRYSDQFWRDA
jgi:hypothetical protein